MATKTKPQGPGCNKFEIWTKVAKLAKPQGPKWQLTLTKIVEAYISLESDVRVVANSTTYESAVLGVAEADKLRELRRSRGKTARPLVSREPMHDIITGQH
ncbi:hypothetical protein Hanom_Chr17g01551111 [Helianthus anomalus]